MTEDDPENRREERLGIEWLLTTQVAKKEGVHPTTVERWIDKGLPAVFATRVQIGQLIAQGFLANNPPRGVFLIRKADLRLIPIIREQANKKKGKRGRRD